MKSVTLLTALLLLGGACVSQSKYDTLQGDLATARSTLAEREAALKSREMEASRRVAEYQELLSRLKEFIDAGKLNVRIIDGRMVVVLPSDVLFASASDRLSPEGREAIQEVAKVLVDVPDRNFQIEGHTDDWPIQTRRFPSNWELASGRAITVLNTMIQAGMPAERVRASSYADTRPVGDNETKDGRALNRRIEIVVVPDLSQLPGFKELQEASGENTAPAETEPAVTPATEEPPAADPATEPPGELSSEPPSQPAE